MGLSPELFKRLSRLNQLLCRSGPAQTGVTLSSCGSAAHGAIGAEPVLPGQERRTGHGRMHVVSRSAAEFLEGLVAQGSASEPDDLPQRHRRVLFGAGRRPAPEDLHEDLRPLAAVRPDGLVYLDVETCGLMGEPVFLVGLLTTDGRGLTVEQYLARDYSEERAVLAALWDRLAAASCLVTFNGKTFDVPAVETRSLACGLFGRPPVPPHVDLLYEARRRWRGVLPNCRLQTIEQLLCGRRRAGDIPGCEIPAAYHEFVKARSANDLVRRCRSIRTMQAILYHNALDLLTMADMVTRLLG